MAGIKGNISPNRHGKIYHAEYQRQGGKVLHELPVIAIYEYAHVKEEGLTHKLASQYFVDIFAVVEYR